MRLTKTFRLSCSYHFGEMCVLVLLAVKSIPFTVKDC